MSFDFAERFAKLEKRVEALERNKTASPRQLGVLYAQARVMKARGDALREEVRAILETHKGPRRLKAFSVRSYLRRLPLPSLRRTQEVIAEIQREREPM